VCLAAARAVVEQGLTASAVSARFGVPYTTLLEWSRKYRAGGEARLVPASGRRQQPARADAAPARRAAIVAAKRAQPGAGNRRIRDVLRRYFGLGTSATTVRRVLREEGLATPRSKPRAKPQPREHRFERAEPNQLWQSDLFGLAPSRMTPT
jgi:transposase